MKTIIKTETVINPETGLPAIKSIITKKGNKKDIVLKTKSAVMVPKSVKSTAKKEKTPYVSLFVMNKQIPTGETEKKTEHPSAKARSNKTPHFAYDVITYVHPAYELGDPNKIKHYTITKKVKSRFPAIPSMKPTAEDKERLMEVYKAKQALRRGKKKDSKHKDLIGTNGLSTFDKAKYTTKLLERIRKRNIAPKRADGLTMSFSYFIPKLDTAYKKKFGLKYAVTKWKKTVTPGGVTQENSSVVYLLDTTKEAMEKLKELASNEEERVSRITITTAAEASRHREINKYKSIIKQVIFNPLVKTAA